jgi:parallel beta-helix repeat protein
MSKGKLIAIALIGVAMCGLFISAASAEEIAYDCGTTENGWSMGSPDGRICSDDGGTWGYAIRMTTPDSEPFTITAIKVFSKRYAEDCNTRFEIWSYDKNTLYSDVVSHSEYSTAVDSWGSATWGYKDIPDVVVSGDFYITMYTDSSDPGDTVYPDTGVYVGYDTSFSSDRSHTVQGKTLTWDLSSPQETTNWMIRVEGIEGAQGTPTPITPASKTIYVDDDFRDDPINHKWNTIKEGIADAVGGDTIIVKPGTYREHLVIDKQVILNGEGYPVVDGGGTGTVIWIRADEVHIEGFKVMQCDPARENREKGIKVRANECVVDHCIISGNNIGLSTHGRDNLISNCKFNDNRIGLVVSGGGEWNTVKNNHFTKCGLTLDNAKNNLIIGNIIELDPTPGISIYNKADNNIFVGNTIRSNSMVAFEIVGSEWGPTSNGNKIYHNNIIDNGWDYQVYDDGNNQWDNGAEGNYWSDYEGEDADGDGIGDAPYAKIGDAKTGAKSGAKDNYPLMGQWTEPERFGIGVSVTPCSYPVQTQSRGMSGRYSLIQGEYADLVRELKDKGVTRMFVSVYYTVEIDGVKKGVVSMKKSGEWVTTVEEPIYPPQNKNEQCFDLEELLTEAHKAGMEVHACVDCFMFLNESGKVNGIDPTGASGLNQQIRLFSVVDYLLSNFKDDQNDGLDGIHLDYIRYVEPLDAKGDDITVPLFLKNLNEQVIKGRAELSASVRAATNEGECDDVKKEIGQNYATMSEHLNFICPMAYHYGDHWTDPSEPPFDYKQPSYVGDVTRFVKSEVKGSCMVIPYLQGYHFYMNGGKEISVLETPGFNEIFNAGKSATDNGADGVNVFRYHHLSDDELNAIKALAEDDFENPTPTDTAPAIEKPPEKPAPGFGVLGVLIAVFAVIVLKRKQI